MAKSKMKLQKQPIKQKAEKDLNLNILPKKYETWICIGIILISLLIFYGDVIFKDKVFLTPDNVTSAIGAGKTEENIFPLWTPYIFSGMPSFGSLMTNGDRWFDFTRRIMDYTQIVFGQTLLRNGWLILYYFVFGLSIFLLMVHKGHNKIVSAFSAVAILFCTTVVGWAFTGHPNKVMACAFFPFIFMLVDKLREKMNWIYVVLLAIAIHLEMESNHLQMTYYFYFFLGIYLAYYFFRSLKNKVQLLGIVRSTIILGVCTLFALAMSADRNLSVLEYSKYSIRGTSPLILDDTQKPPESQPAEEGALSYDYATNWSFSPGEVMTFFIPSYYGFGAIDNYKGVIPFRQNGVTPNTYFGQMTFTDSPQYLGVLVLILAGIGFIYYRKKIFVQALLIIGIFGLLVSFGREWPLLYDLLFKYFPYFNKFRVPVMILILFEISMVILAGYGLSAIIDIYKNGKDNVIKKIKYALFVFVGLLVLAFIGKGIINDIYRGVFEESLKVNTHQIIVDFINRNPRILESEYAGIFTNMINDLYISLIIISVFLGVAYLFIKRKLHTGIFYAAAFIILLFDLWRVDGRPFEARPSREFQAQFNKPDYVEFIEKDKSNYRALEIIDNRLQTSNLLASFGIQNINGYSAAKIRIYQDVIENCFNPFVWNLLNTKYIISNSLRDTSLKLVFTGPASGLNVYENVRCLPRAFFVNRFEVLDKRAIVKKLQSASFDPREVAFFESDPGVKVDPVEPAADVKQIGFSLHTSAFEVNATGNNLLFLSEVYYPAGWKAYIDGAETPIYKTNYLFRSIIVPKGNHKIDLIFDPESFKIGKNVTLFTNLFTLLLLAGFGVYYIISRKKVSK